MKKIFSISLINFVVVKIHLRKLIQHGTVKNVPLFLLMMMD